MKAVILTRDEVIILIQCVDKLRWDLVELRSDVQIVLIEKLIKLQDKLEKVFEEKA